MKIISIISSLLLLYSLEVYAELGNCSENDLRTLNIIETPIPMTNPGNNLFKAMKIFEKVGNKLMMSLHRNNERVYLAEISKLFNTHGINGLKDECVGCFASNVQCIVMNCKVPCSSGQCTKACKKCYKSRCEVKLLKCIGDYQMLDPCDEEKAFIEYKLPKLD